MEFSHKIKQIIQKRNITQEKLAEELGISFATVNRWCQGHIKPRESTLQQIDKYCKDYMIDINEEEKPNLFVGVDLVTVSDLQSWFSSNQRLSQGLFPELIEKLIIESSSNNLKHVRFPSKDKIVTTGFDGEVISIEKNNYFVPSQESVWEIGATLNRPKDKLIDDYIKRSKFTTLEYRQKTTFVLVTAKSLSYNTRKSLLQQFSKDNWKEVKVYDGVFLEQWLSQCLKTSLWLIEQFKKEKIEIQTFEMAYSDFESRTNPQLSPNLFTINRDNDVEKFVSYCNNSHIIKVSSPSAEETYGFVLSSLYKTNDTNLQSKVLVCNDINTLRRFDKLCKNKLFIFTGQIDSLNFNLENKCIVLFGKNTFKNNVDVCLSARPQSCIFDVLKNEMKIPQDKLENLSHKVKNNVMLIMRELHSESYIYVNEWAKEEKLTDLIPILMLGRINKKSSTDLKLLSLFLEDNVSVEKYLLSLHKNWEYKDNSPLVFHADFISVNLKEELWSWISNQISDKIFDKLKTALNNIFTTSNPKYDLSIDKQPAHQIYSKNWEFNKYIVEGLFDSFILFTIYNDKQYEADVFVKNLLESLDTKQKMLTIAEFFTSVSELSPEQFLAYVNNDIIKNDSLVLTLFETSDAPALFSGGHEYCNLLWALELLTQLNETKLQSIDTLIKIHLKNYKYNMANTPKESIFCNIHWMCSKNALTFNDKKLAILKFLDKYDINFVNFVIELIGKNNLCITRPSLKWKSSDNVDEVITWQMVFEANESFIAKILDIVKGNNLETIIKLFDIHRHLTNKSLDLILDHLQNFYNKDTSYGLEIYEYFIKKKYNVLKYNKEGNESHFLDICNKAIFVFKPTNDLDANMIYFQSFGYDCPILETIDDDFDIEEKNTKVFQTKLFAKLYKEFPHSELFEKIIKNFPNNGFDGRFIAEQQLTNEDVNLIIDIADKQDKYEFLLNFLIDKDEDLFDAYINKQSKEALIKIIPFIRHFVHVPKCIIEDEDLLKIFYKQRSYHENLEEFDKNYIKKYNPMSFIRHLLYRDKSNLCNIDEIISTLNNVSQETIRNSNDYYYIKEMLEKIEQEYNDIDILQLEIKFFNVYQYDEIPEGIKKYFFNNPDEYIKFIISPPKSDENSSHIWFKTYMYMSFPKNFYAENEKIKNFIESVMKYVNQDSDKIKLIRTNLGEILARSYKQEKDTFLPSQLKEILEEISNEEVNKGVIIGYENSRGVRTITDGTPEFELAKKYNELAIENDMLYPQSAKILRQLSKSRKNDAERDKTERMFIDGLL